MATADIINAVAAGTTVSTAKKVGKGKKAVELTVTRTAPEVKVVDETVDEAPAKGGLLPADAGKRTVEVLPGIKLAVMSKGYLALKLKGKGWTGGKVELGKPLYREECRVLIEALLAEVESLKSYEEAHGIESAPAVDLSAFENVPF
jgi:hypothetical protein